MALPRTHRVPARVPCGLLLILAACEPSVTTPVKVMAIVPDRQGTYDARQVELTTPTSVIHMTGPLLTLIGGAQVELTPNDQALVAAITANNEEQLFDVLLENEGASVRANLVDRSGASLPAPLTNWTLASFNLLKAMDEGFADFHGYGVTCATSATGAGCKSSLLSDSFEDQAAVAARDITNPEHCLTWEDRTAFNSFSPGQFVGGGRHYRIGTLIAASLYQASVTDGKEDLLQKALVSSLDDPSSRTPGFRQVLSFNLQTPQAFTPEVMADIIAAHIPDLALKKSVCRELSDRLNLEVAAIPRCLAVAAGRGTICKQLGPE